MLIDSHAHLEMEPFDKDRDEVIKRAQKEGVKLIVNVGTSVDGSRKSVQLAQKYNFIYAAVGIHPHDADHINESSYKAIEELALHEKVIAIGEVGLDYYKNYSQKAAQKELFRRFVRMAKKYDKPVIIHSRDAKVDMLEMLREEKAHNLRGILHCFSGDEELMFEAIEMGFYISFAGQVTYPRATNIHELVKKVPTERLLLETDCPFLAPQSMRGKRNEPSCLQHTLKKVATLRGVGTYDIERVISVNFSTLFDIYNDNFNLTRNVSYKIRNTLYLNVTNRCSNVCSFCSKFTSLYVQGHDLKLDHEPTLEEVINSIDHIKRYDEIVICGFGEPTMRLDLVKKVAKYIKDRGGKTRLNSNGHGNIINKRNILPELEGLIDSISISLNAENEKKYNDLCRPVFNFDVYNKVCEFIIESKKYIPKVTATVVDIPDAIDIEQCERMVKEEFGVNFRVRRYNMVGA